jgi:hypothetical protein
MAVKLVPDMRGRIYRRASDSRVIRQKFGSRRQEITKD